MIIIIIIIIIIIKTIISLKIWEVFRNSASYSLIVTFTRRKNTGMSAAATTYLTPLIWGEDPGQSYPEETKVLCMVLGLVASQRTGFSLFGNYRRRQSSKINSS